jgi:ketosteroid isomerase-like protein
MFQLDRCLPLLAVFLVGCASARTTRLNASQPKEQAQIERRLQEILEAAEQKDWERLEGYHFFGPKFSKYAADSLGRQDARTARQDEREGLSALAGLSMRALDLKIDVFDQLAIATFIVESRFQTANGPLTKKARSTLVFVREGGDWKIAHEHFSALKSNP